QTCIAPDYALVPEGAVDAFVDEAVCAASRFYPDPLHGTDYTAIVSERHYARLTGWLAEAGQAGARVVPLIPGHEPDPLARRIPPVAATGAPEACALAREEILGPVLPVVAYRWLDEAHRYVMGRPRPLALY